MGFQVDRLDLWLRCSVPARVQVQCRMPASSNVRARMCSEATAELHADDLPDDKACLQDLIISSCLCLVQDRGEALGVQLGTQLDPVTAAAACEPSGALHLGFRKAREGDSFQGEVY